MKTSTLFNAYTKARDELHDACVVVAGTQTPRALRSAIKTARRRDRQSSALERVIKARLGKKVQP